MGESAESSQRAIVSRDAILSEAERIWFLRLRWAAVLVEACVVGFFGPRGLPLAVLVAGHALSNGGLSFVRVLHRRLLTAVLLSDSWWLALMLGFAGGPANPFAALFFVHVTLAAVMTSPRWTGAAWLNATIAYGVTFSFAGTHVHGGFSDHLYGMFVAFAVTAGLIAIFVSRLSRALLEREEALRRLEVRAAASARVASLTTLAAGAAHELGSPLGTIAVVAGELASSAEGEAKTDLELIRSEVRRCRTILDAMALGAGDSAGELPQDVSLRQLVEGVCQRLGPGEADRVEQSGEARFHVPPRAMTQLLHNLVRNALDASEQTVRIAWDGATLRVRDRGAGMDADVLAHAFDPFFTTKDPVAGGARGLGLFLVRTVAEQLGLEVRLEARAGGGTDASVLFPPSARLDRATP